MRNSKFENLENRIFGKWKVLRFDARKNKKIYWVCECQCENKTIKSILGSNLKGGRTNSCGCEMYIMASKKRTIDLTDRRFGRLVVLGRFSKVGEFKKIKWLCECDCGNFKITTRDSLYGNCNSCGCINREKLNERNSKDIKNQRFGLLVAKKIVGKDKNNQYIWECLCDCGNITKARTNALIVKNKSSCGCLTESLIAHELKKYYKTTLDAEIEYSIFINPKTKYPLPFDIYLKKENVFIEVNGKQHYVFMKNWHKTLDKFEYEKERDRMKRKYARKNGKYIEIDLRKIKSTEEAIAKIDLFLQKI